MAAKLRIIVGGMAGIFPVGGMAWHYLQYVAGLSKLGHDVYYFEDTRAWPYHPVEKQNTSRGEYSARFLQQFFEQYAPGLCGKWCYLHLREDTFGMSRQQFDQIASGADLFLNVSGACEIPHKLSPKCVKVFLDTDPGYNQITLSKGFENPEIHEPWYRRVADYDRHLTFAENIHQADCTVPQVGVNWITTRPPVVLELWSRLAKIAPDRQAPWTTVMTWNAFRDRLTYHGAEYKSKGSEFARFLDLPRRVGRALNVAVGGQDAPVESLQTHGWNVLDGPLVTCRPSDYQTFIAGSWGEFSTAKHVYVAMKTGWFSDRSACYLAAGRPVVLQDTGFSDHLPVGLGIVPFTTLEEAAAALREVESKYARHARAALEIANAHFDSDRVLSRLLDDTF
jgi:hypothetical protein